MVDISKVYVNSFLYHYKFCLKVESFILCQHKNILYIPKYWDTLTSSYIVLKILLPVDVSKNCWIEANSLVPEQLLYLQHLIWI